MCLSEQFYLKSHNLFHFIFKIAEDSPLVDLQRFLVPTTTKLINAISQVEPMVLERTRSPVLMELARASLDFMLSTDPRSGKLMCILIRTTHYYYFETKILKCGLEK
jgi:hypothetical protein